MKTETHSNKKLGRLKEFVKWSLILFLVSAGVVTNYYYRTMALPLRLIGWLVLLCITAFVVLQTTVGRKIGRFALDARMELRKVVWRSRKETIRLTLTVAVIVVVASFMLWGIDGIFLWLVGWLTGQRG